MNNFAVYVGLIVNMVKNRKAIRIFGNKVKMLQ